MDCSISKSQSQAAVRSLCFLNVSEKSRCGQVHLVSDLVNSLCPKGLSRNIHFCSLWPCTIHNFQAKKSLCSYFIYLFDWILVLFTQTATSEQDIPAEGWGIHPEAACNIEMSVCPVGWIYSSILYPYASTKVICKQLCSLISGIQLLTIQTVLPAKPTVLLILGQTRLHHQRQKKGKWSVWGSVEVCVRHI